MLKMYSTIAVRKLKITKAFEHSKENFLICIAAKISNLFFFYFFLTSDCKVSYQKRIKTCPTNDNFAASVGKRNLIKVKVRERRTYRSTDLKPILKHHPDAC